MSTPSPTRTPTTARVPRRGVTRNARTRDTTTSASPTRTRPSTARRGNTRAVSITRDRRTAITNVPILRLTIFNNNVILTVKDLVIVCIVGGHDTISTSCRRRSRRWCPSQFKGYEWDPGKVWHGCGGGGVPVELSVPSLVYCALAMTKTYIRTFNALGSDIEPNSERSKGHCKFYTLDSPRWHGSFRCRDQGTT